MIIVVANQKGGVGKTTTAINLAYGMSQCMLSTLLVDLDAQGNAASALGHDPAPDLYNWLINRQAPEITRSRPYLDLIRSNKSSANLEYSLQASGFAEYALADALAEHAYRVVIIDCAPSIAVLQVAAIMAADLMIIPTTLTQLSLEGMTQIIGTLNQLQRRGSHCRLFGILPTRYERTKRDQLEQLNNLASSPLGAKLWAPVPTDASVDKSHRAGKTLAEFAPLTRAWIDGYQPAVQRLWEVC